MTWIKADEKRRPGTSPRFERSADSKVCDIAARAMAPVIRSQNTQKLMMHGPQAPQSASIPQATGHTPVHPLASTWHEASQASVLELSAPDQAGVLSRNSRRRILPTADFGRLSRNSITFGCL